MKNTEKINNSVSLYSKGTLNPYTAMLWHSTLICNKVHHSHKRNQTRATGKGFKIHQYLEKSQTNHLKTCHVSMNVIENELSQHMQIFPALLQEPFDQMCSWWQHPKIDFFISRHSLYLNGCSRIVLVGSEPVCLPPVSLLGQVVGKITSLNCKVILIALSCPKISLFWTLGMFSSHIPL